MLEFFAGLATGYLLTWPTLITLAVLGILFEHNNVRGFAVFTAIVSAVLAFFFFDISLKNLAIGSAVYLVIGVLWSFWRYKRHADKAVEEIKQMTDDAYRKYAIKALHPSQMIDTFVAWIIVWPFSLVENLTADIINGIQRLVTTAFKSVYNKIYTSAIKTISLETKD